MLGRKVSLAYLLLSTDAGVVLEFQIFARGREGTRDDALECRRAGAGGKGGARGGRETGVRRHVARGVPQASCSLTPLVEAARVGTDCCVPALTGYR